MKLSNWSILAKLSACLALLGLVVGGAVWYATERMHHIDETYAVLVEKTLPSALQLARARAASFNNGRLLYRIILEPTSQGKKEVVQEASANHEAFKKFLGEARSNLPDFSDAFAEISRLADDGYASFQKIADATLSGNDQVATQLALQTKETSTRTRDAIVKLVGAIDEYAHTRREHAAKSTQTTISRTIWAVIVGFGSALGLVFAVVRFGVTGPLDALSQTMRKLAGGDLDVAVESSERGDEVGNMAKSVLVFKENGLKARAAENDARKLREAADRERQQAEAHRAAVAQEQSEIVDRLGNALSKLADRDLTVSLSGFPADYRRLETDFNAAVVALREALSLVATNANMILSGSGEISGAADDLSKRTEQQAASLEQTAAALDQITVTGKKAADGANHARDVVVKAKQDAENTGATVRKAVDAMGGIERSAQKITQIIGVIDEIAFQTNLLALNAGVEAARAGDAGRGFAVVASEVRALAQRSADAAKEIKGLISTSTAQVSDGVELVAETGKALERILAQVGDINSAVVDIASGAQEQATGLAQVNAAINQMDQATQQNAAMVEQSTAASHSLAQEATQLSDLIRQFKIENSLTPVKGVAAVQHRGAQSKPSPIKNSSLSSGGSAVIARKKYAAPVEAEWTDF